MLSANVFFFLLLLPFCFGFNFLNPQRDEVIIISKDYLIQWNETNSSLSFDLELLGPSGTQLIERDIPTTEQSYSWKPKLLDTPPSTSYRLKATIKETGEVIHGPPSGFFTLERSSITESLLWILGVLLSITGSLLSNFGLNLQKYSLVQEKKTKKFIDRRPYFQQSKYQVGFVFIVLGAIFDFSALAFAPTSLIAPTGGSTIIFSLIFSHFMLKEKIGWLEIVSCCFIASGIVVVALYSPKSTNSITLDRMIQLFGQKDAIAYIVSILVVCFTLYIIAKKLIKRREEKGFYHASYKEWESWHMLSTSSLSGFLGAQSILMAKALTEIVKSIAYGDKPYIYSFPYLLLALMLFFIFSQIHFMALALQFFDAIQIYPIFQALFITISVIGGGILFNEFEGMNASSMNYFVLGLVFILLGILILTQRAKVPLSPAQRLKASMIAVLFVSTLQLRSLEKKFKVKLTHRRSSRGLLEGIYPISPNGQAKALSTHDLFRFIDNLSREISAKSAMQTFISDRSVNSFEHESESMEAIFDTYADKPSMETPFRDGSTTNPQTKASRIVPTSEMISSQEEQEEEDD